MVSISVEELALIYPLRIMPSGKTPVATRRGAQEARFKERGGRRYLAALDGISFSLKSGDRLGLVGRNGSGKTTLLKALYGIYPPTTGRIDIVGRVDALFNIALGFRREATGRRNIELRGLINGWSPAEIAQRMDAIIEFTELGEFIDLPFKTYSQGMAARLAFAVATSLEPEILLMDEWIGAGDPAFQEKARARMSALASNAGIIVLATHNHDLIKRTCNKVLELENGRVKKFYASMDGFT
jgi:homopolymeric O-antigen transport system ATP-binding protein